MVASILVLGAHLWIFDLNTHLTKEGVHLWAETLFYVTSSLILTGTAIAAAWRFRIFRMGEAAIKIDLDVTSRRSSPTYNALSAVAIVTNTSKVVTRFTEVQWEVRVLSPYTDAAVADKVKEYKDYYSVSKDPVEFPWNVNYALSQQDARIYLEPGESNTVSMGLAIPDWIKAIDVRLVLSAPPSRKNRQNDAWVARSTHDLPVEVRNGNQTSDP